MVENRRPTGGTAARDVVIVHSSDLHVDDDYTARTYGGDGTLGLRAVLETARARAADLVILAGDVFDHNRVPVAIIDRATRLLGDCGMEVVVLPGNHDPALPASVYRRAGLADPANVHILGVTHEASVVFPAWDLEVWGNAHRDYEDMAPLASPLPRRVRWHVAVAHGHYEPVPDRSVVPRAAWLIGDAEIAATAADYVALGHWNRPARVGPDAMHAFYSGSPDYARSVNLVRLAADGRVVVERSRITTNLPVDGPVHD